MEKRRCSKCNKILPPYTTGSVCPECVEAAFESAKGNLNDYYNVRDMAALLNIGEEQVRRLSREDDIPGRVPLIKRHLFVKEIVDSWIKQDQPIPRMPTTPLQEEAKALCENDDHDWLSDERFNGIAYSSRDDTRQQSETVISVGYTRTCYFCGYTTFVASLYNY